MVGWKCLAEVKIQRGLFQWDTLSPLLIIKAMMPNIDIFRKYTGDYKLYRSQEKINHIDDIKLFAKNEKEQEALMQAVRIYSPDIGMEFGIENCAIFIMRSRKRRMTEGIELTNQEKIKMLRDEETYKYFANIGRCGDEKIIKKESLRRTRKLLEIKLNEKYLIKRMNTWVVSLVRYSGPFFVVDGGRTSTNEPDNKKTNDDA